MRLGLLARPIDPEQARQAADIARRMADRGLEPQLLPELAARFAEHGLAVEWPVLEGNDLGNVALMVSLGGDGAILETVDRLGRRNIPILGINLGRLGFLSNTRTEELDGCLQALQDGAYELEERTLVEVGGAGDRLAGHDLALNEVSVHKQDSSSMIAIHAYLGERFLNTYWADGLIVATPTGSTAYSLSCGGPLLDPNGRSLVIAPIAPHNLTVRPFVVPDHYPVRLFVDSREDNYLVNLDSRSVTLEGRRELVVRRSEHTVKLVQLPGQDFLDTLRTKLAWGLDVRSTPPVGGKP